MTQNVSLIRSVLTAFHPPSLCNVSHETLSRLHSYNIEFKGRVKELHTFKTIRKSGKSENYGEHWIWWMTTGHYIGDNFAEGSNYGDSTLPKSHMNPIIEQCGKHI
jgi:hypothetical protein